MSYVLVVDDCALHQEMLVKGLQIVGITCIGVTDIDDAIHLMKDNLPELIILEPLAARSRAYLFYQQLQNNPLTRRIPIILLTAASQGDMRRYHQIRRGQVTCLSKPYSLNSIISMVRQFA
jgi:CheY-like chemotaxis protein